MGGVSCMMNRIMDRLARIAWRVRGGLAQGFAYHGPAPRLLGLSPQEVAMTEAHGLGSQVHWRAPRAGGLALAEPPAGRLG